MLGQIYQWFACATPVKCCYLQLGQDASINDKDLYPLRYAEFLAPLVKPVQELSTQHDELIKENDEILKRIEKLEKILIVKK